MIVVLNELLTSLRTLIYDKSIECLLNSGASHNFLFSNWSLEWGQKFDNDDRFGVNLTDRQEVSAINNVQCLPDLVPMKIALKFNIFNYNIPYIFSLQFNETII